MVKETRGSALGGEATYGIGFHAEDSRLEFEALESSLSTCACSLVGQRRVQKWTFWFLCSTGEDACKNGFDFLCSTDEHVSPEL